MDRQELHALLSRYAEWLLLHCRREAGGADGLEAEDLMQEALIVAVRYIASGWFDRAPHVSLEAQTRTLLRLSVTRAKHNWIRAKARRGALESAVPEEAEGGWDRVAGSDFVVDPRWSTRTIGDAIGHVRALPSALQRLALLSFHFPFAVGPADLNGAAKESKSPVRPPDAAWPLFQAHLPEWPALEDKVWRRLVAEIVRSTKAMGEISQTERDRLLNAMESHASTGTERLEAERVKRGVEGGE